MWHTATKSLSPSHSPSHSHSQVYDGIRHPGGHEVILGAFAMGGLTGRPLHEQRVLDMGCGTGNYACAVAPHVHTMVCFDGNASMLARWCVLGFHQPDLTIPPSHHPSSPPKHSTTAPPHHHTTTPPHCSTSQEKLEALQTPNTPSFMQGILPDLPMDGKLAMS